MTAIEHSELLRRLSRIPPERRAMFLQRLRGGGGGQEVAVPLSEEQRQVWILRELTAQDQPHWLTVAIRIDGPVDTGRLRGAVSAIAQRHESLRTQVHLRDGEPLCVARADADADIAMHHLGPVPAARRTQVLRELVEAHVAKPIDPERDPLWMSLLVRFTPAEHVLLWIAHYLVLDPDAGPSLLAELATAYSGGHLDQPATPYRDYAAWQRRWLESPEAAAVAGTLRERFAGVDPVDLPTDRARPIAVTFEGAETVQALGHELGDQLSQMARQLGVSAEAVLLAGYAIFLHRWTRQSDLVIGLPWRTRPPAGMAPPVGNLSNLLPVRIGCEDDTGLAELAMRASAALDNARAAQAMPYGRVLEAVQAPRVPGRMAFVQNAFRVSQPPATARAGDTTFTLHRVPATALRYEISLDLELAPELPVRLGYNSNLFSAGSAQRMLDSYARLLAAGVRHPSRPASLLTMVPSAERARLISGWNQQVRPAPPRAIPDVFQQVAARHADRPALRDRLRSLSYRETDAAANRLARHLAGLGTPPEGRIAVYMHRSIESVVAVLAVLKAGGAYVPLDPAQPADRVARILADSGAVMVIADELASRVPDGPWRTIQYADAVAAGGEDAPLDLPISPRRLAYVIYTSGSTGMPKGVLIEHESVVHFVETVTEMFTLTPADRFVQYASMGFDVSVFEMFGSLLTGASLFIADEDDRRSVERLTDLLISERITVVDLPPAMMNLLEPELFTGLRVAFVGGEAFTGELTTRWAAGGRMFVNGYGVTEATVTQVAKTCRGIWHTSPPIGRAMANLRAYALDSRLEPVPVGVPGELFLSGRGLARGYCGRADLTAAVFVPDPYHPEPGQRMYRTGDLVKWSEDGELVFLGRADRQVKIHGQRIEPGEIEAALASQEGVLHAVVEAVRRDGGAILIGYVVLRDGAGTTGAALRELISRQLPQYMVPAAIVAVDSIPLTPSGKVDARRLPPVDLDALAPADGAAFSTPTERRVADEVFCHFLRGGGVGPHDNFFALGGNSLEAIQVLSRVRRLFGVDVSAADFFADPTVTRLASAIDEASRPEPEDDLLAIMAEVEAMDDEAVARELAAGQAGAAGGPVGAVGPAEEDR